ncbi:hypothetical protein [Paenibacillus jilunlii]|uniref:Uncharacterized protein n=1 Tax=Paenibacillus jilunlii TaxID=682956 RepID=A0A1G9KYD3_9BACL|nr:hypothetical protein [Paenibacillus jilunlii]KWX69789.1 hypothetical protein AML91_28835 [Paenibacillus jilunlii]SDL54860.1 hypothetical protein SAMN05216191_103439 [Paenibacillus jilunlii]
MPIENITFPDLAANLGKPAAIQALKGTGKDAVSLLALDQNSDLWQIDLHAGRAAMLLHVDIPGLELQEPVQIVVSADERFAAVSGRFSQHAALYDLQESKLITPLSRDDYHYDVCTFPLAFAEHEGRTLLIHGTEWNRLDMLDVRSGENMTARQNQPHVDEQRPEHNLDYFHSKIHISPQGDWIVDTGWIWHPIASIRSWSLSAWLSNCWESEDGATLRKLGQLMEDWDQPAVWLDSYTLAIWGQLSIDMYEEEDMKDYGEHLYSHFLAIFDVQTGEQKGLFTPVPAYRTKPPINGGMYYPQGQIAAVNGRIVMWGPENGLSILNPDTSEMEFYDEKLCPDFYHPYAGVFLEIDESGRIAGKRLTFK